MIELHPYQNEGVDFLATRRFALLADEMGLGKSAQLIRACEKIEARNILIVCPASAQENWWRELDKFRTYSGPSITKVTSYDRLRRELLAYQMASSFLKWDAVLIDESHLIKEPSAARSRAVLGTGGIIHFTKRMYFASGTPAPNHAGELWPILFVTRQTNLSYSQFIQKYCVTEPGYRDDFVIKGTKKEMIPELRELLKPIMLRRMKKDVLKDLPPIYFSDVPVIAGGLKLSDSENAKFKAELERLTAALDFELCIENEDDLLRALEGVARSVSTLRRVIGVQKAAACGEMVKEELMNGAYEKIVIFAIHRDAILILNRILQPFNPAVITGDTPVSERMGEVDKFQNDPSCHVMLANIGAASTALNMTAAHNILLVEEDWTPANNAQAIARVHRIGQKYPVHARIASIMGSIDEKVSRILRRKTGELAQIFDA